MVSVYCCDTYAHRIKACTILVKVHGYNRVAMLRGKADGCLTVPLMHLYRAVFLLEADDLVARQWMAVRASYILGILLTRKICGNEPSCLISGYMFEPVFLRLGIFICTDLHAVSPIEDSLNRRQLSVDSGIVGMLSDTAVDFKGEVKGCSSFREYDSPSLRGEDHDVVVIE